MGAGDSGSPSSSSDLERTAGTKLGVESDGRPGVLLNVSDVKEAGVVRRVSRACDWCGSVTRDGLRSLSESMVTTIVAMGAIQWRAVLFCKAEHQELEMKGGSGQV